MNSDLNQREVLQGAAAATLAGVLGSSTRTPVVHKSAPAASWAGEFDGWVAGRLAARDFVGVQSRTSAPHARLVHPSAEHLQPLFFVLGAALPEDRVTPVFEGFHYATLSMRSFALRG